MGTHGQSGSSRQWVRWSAVVLAVGGLLAVPGPAGAVGSASSAGAPSAAKPFLDSRTAVREQAVRAGKTVAAARPAARTTRARAALRRSLGLEGVIDVDPLTGTPRMLARTDGALSAARGGDRVAIAREFVGSHEAVLGLDDADVAGLALASRASTGRGLTVVRFGQAYRGIPTFDNDLRVAIDHVGRVQAVTGSPRHDLSVPSVDPAIGAAEALARLQRNVGVVRAESVRSGPSGARHTTTFARGDGAQLVLFGAAAGARLAWHVTYAASSAAHYDAVLDAATGAVLYRANLVKSEAGARVYPDHPGASASELVDLEDFGLTPGATTLTGTFAHAWSDLNDDNAANAGEEVPPSAGTDFLYPFTALRTADPDCAAPTRCGWNSDVRTSWMTNRAQNAVQAFYLVSRYHDHLAGPEVLFTDDWGSFEVGGTGGDDPVLVQADDGAATGDDGGPDPLHEDNANMSTPPDGESPTMQMYLFTDAESPDGFNWRSVNGGDDSGVVWHEYTHGLSNRLVVNADGNGALSTAQAGAMGEAWSDWYASDFQVAEGFKTDARGTPGEIDVGAYTDADPHTLRTQALDCPVGAVADACPGGFATGVGGYTYGNFAQIVPGGGAEVHADGEIWSETLWDLRQALQVKFASDEAGSQLAEILVSDGMRVSPPEPSMLDMRNAILTADQIDFGGQLHGLIWDVFRHRGMGYFAGAADGADTAPVEDFTAPPNAGGPTGTVTGRVVDASSGLPIAGVRVGLGGHASNPGFDEFLGDDTGADGSYTITGVPAGTYPKLAFTPSAGFDAVVVRNVTVAPDETATRDATMRRDWAGLSGGAKITAVSDDTGAQFGCGGEQLVDQSQGTTWSAFNPTSEDPANPHAGSPTLTVQLPETIEVSAFLLDPAAGCGDGLSSSTREFKVETSTDGTTFRTAVDGTGDNAFTDDNVGKLNSVTPTGTSGQNVRYVRLTLLHPLREGDDCAPTACSGTDFIDFSELEVLGGKPNVLPTGSLRAAPRSVERRDPVTFTASFTDPDSAIAGYDWDFDANGTIDRTTDTATTQFAYDAAGSYTARVAARDFRGGSTTASTTVTVTRGASGPPGPPGPPGPSAPVARPVLHLHAAGSGGAVIAGVACARRCTVTAHLSVGRRTAKRLGLGTKRIGVGNLKRSVGPLATHRLAVHLRRRVLRAARRRGIERITATLTVTAAYSTGRHRSATRTVRIRL